MSTKLEVLNKTGGKHQTELQVTHFWGGGNEHGPMIQLTQGLAGSVIGKIDDLGYVQLTKNDATKLICILSKWLSDNQ